MSELIHKGAIIHPTASIHPTAVIGANVTIGAGAYIGPYCIIGAPAEHRGRWQQDMEFGVIIHEKAILTGMVTVDAGMERNTEICAGAFLMKHSHVGHDAIVDAGATISCGAKIGGHCVIGAGVNIGLNATIHQRVFVPDGCMIGMGTVVTKTTDMMENSKYVGVPARYIGPNIIKQPTGKVL